MKHDDFLPRTLSLQHRLRFLTAKFLTKSTQCLLVCLGVAMVCPVMVTAAEPPSDSVAIGSVAISTEFPGGNALVESNEEGTVHVAPDLRGDSPWFYWYFEATAKQPGRVKFVFPEEVIGFKNGAIGLQGPAVSHDNGKTWRWMGTEQVEGSSFYYDFSEAGERVQLAVTIPYVESNYVEFMKLNADNPHLKPSVLTKSRHGRDVELLQIGEPGSQVTPVLVTARHHATESIASYVLEGFLQAAMSDLPDGAEFRKRFVLFAVPFVDKDGVEEGDQGKNRKPHDHNRDYGENSIYPEVQAIKELDETHDFLFAVDFHCPTLVMPDHQVMYFVGAKQNPQYNFENVTEFARGIKQGLPENAPAGPMVWLRDETEESPKSSRYFGFQEGTIMSATLEIPFAPPGRATEADSCRQYGEVILKAWVNTHFRAPDGKP